MKRPVSVVAMCSALALSHTVAAQQPTAPNPPQPSPLPGLRYDAPFFPGAQHDPNIPPPDAILGFPVGERPAMHAQVEAVIRDLAQRSPRARLFEYARSHEGRTLWYMIVSSEANIQRLDQIKADAARLGDPRNLSAANADRLTRTMPAVAWMAYVIHGDEMSGTDASLALAWHLCASTDAAVQDLLSKVIVVIDPNMNPDGRDRCITEIREYRTVPPSVDSQSILHTGLWPSGRMNHYLFDLNRDWILGTQPESRGRIASIGSWNPHLLMESHEMWPLDTFLFSPPREPVNPHLAASMKRWWDVFAKDLAASFDRYGWRYYHGEWNEEWYPGYSSAWAGYRGAIDILFEQAAIAIDAVRRPEGTLMTYRESVHHQLEGSLAVLRTTAGNREAILRDYLAQRRENVSADGLMAKRLWAVVPSKNLSRTAAFVDLMRLQGFEVFAAPRAFRAAGKDQLGRAFTDREFPAGTILLPARQPEGRLLTAMLEFDTRMTPEFLQVERRELLRFDRSKLYDITGWNLTMLHDVEGYELSIALPEGAARYEAPPAPPAPAAAADRPPTAIVIDGADDLSVALAGRLMERGIEVRASDKPFAWDGRSFARGSIVVSRADNQRFTGDWTGAVHEACRELGLVAVPIASGLGPGNDPDIGGEHFIRLEPPRIAVMAHESLEPYGVGEVWHLLDQTMALRASYLDANNASSMDLRRYNVLVIPNGGGSFFTEKPKLEALRDWVKAGGTLIAIGSSAVAAAGKDTGLVTGIRPIADTLKDMEPYRLGVVREWEGLAATVDPEATWSHTPPEKTKFPWAAGKDDEKPSEEEAKRRDEWRAIFMPSGAILAGRVDDRHWLTGGCREYIPLMHNSRTVLMSALPAQAPVRFGVFAPAPAAAAPGGGAPNGAAATPTARRASSNKPTGAAADAKEEPKPDKEEKPKPQPTTGGWAPIPEGQEVRLRMSGLLWPEAADRIANSAYVAREQVGSGQVILFAASPTFRASAKGTMRIMANAMVLGPGMGASHPVKP